MIILGCIFILIVFIGIYLTTIGLSTIGSIIITSVFAILSIILAIASGNLMKSVSEADIQDSIIKLLEIRRRFFDDVILFNTGHLDADKFKGAIEWTTWMNYRSINRAMKYKRYIVNSEHIGDKKAILKSHKILIRSIMKQKYIKDELLMNRHVKQLLMGCELLSSELNDLEASGIDYEEEYTEAFNEYLLLKGEDEDFITWIVRNKEAVNNEDVPFQVLRN